MKKIVYSLFLCFICLTGFGQKLITKKYLNTEINVSYQIPNSWDVLPKEENNKTEFAASCNDQKENIIYKNCFSDVVFYMEKYNLDLNATLEKKGFTLKNDSVFYKDTKGKLNKVQYTQRNNYKGIFYEAKTKINCTSLPKKMQTQGRVDYLFFNLRGGKNTVVIYTTGKALDIRVRNLILESFKFV